jgi:hypothetical protein
MKKFKGLSKNKKLLVISLFFIIFVCGAFYLKEIIKDDNYETKVDCGNGTIIVYEGKRDINIYSECPNIKQPFKNIILKNDIR